jgi:PAS domain S-box-containing protein
VVSITLQEVNEGIYRAMFENAAVGITRVDLDGHLVDVNQKFCDMLGYAPDELMGKGLRDVTHPDDSGLGASLREDLIRGAAVSATGEKRFLRKDGTLMWGRRTMSIVRDAAGEPEYVVSVVEDITERKRTEERQAIEHSVTLLLAHAHSIEGVMPDIIKVLGEGLGYAYGARWEIGSRASHMRCGETWCVADPAVDAFRRRSMVRLETPGGEGGLNRKVWATGAPVWIADLATDPAPLKRREAALQAGLRSAFAFPILVGGGFYGDMEFFAHRERPRDEHVLELAHTVGTQIGQFIARKQAEGALLKSEARFRALTELSSDWYWEQDHDLRFTAVSAGIAGSTGDALESFMGKTRWEIPHEGMSDADWTAHKSVLAARRPFREFEYGRKGARGGISYISVSGEPVFDEAGVFTGYRGIGKDITQRKLAENALREAHDSLARKTTELERSNAELEQFAYVASHDLQEPLRMISSYTQLLLRRHGNRFEGDAKEFMDFVIDGAARMKSLIEDLLAYSRIGRHGAHIQPTDCSVIFNKATANLRSRIDSNAATVTSGPLPKLAADELQLVQLFQNLISNAIKFKGGQPPQVHVSAQEQAAGWVFAVSDNGIGMESQYFERIFMMFQRLHSKAEYPGTGIGLAICKKVIDRHGGRIWVESQPGSGSTFYFSLPKTEGHAHG